MDKRLLRIITLVGDLTWFLLIYWAFSAGLFARVGSWDFVIMIGLFIIGSLLITWGLRRIFS